MTAIACMVCLAGGLMGAPAEETDSMADQQAKRFLQVLPNGYFAWEDGTAYLPLGGFYGNFVHKVVDGETTDERVGSIRDTTPEEKRAWFKVLADNGVNCLRIMSRDHPSEGVDEWDIVGAVNEPLLRDWEAYWELAREYGISILTTLHESYYADYAPYRNRDIMLRMVTEKHYTEEELAELPAYRRRFLEGNIIEDRSEMYTDPDIVRARKDYVDALIPRLRENPSIVLYELENEQDVGIYDWTNLNIDWIRELDKKTPVGISHSGDGLFHVDPLPHTHKTNIDWYSYHIYPVAQVTHEDLDYGTAVSLIARYVMIGTPAGVGESGAHILENGPTDAWRRALARDTVWLPFLSGNNHVMFWDGGQAEAVACGELSRVIAEVDLAKLNRKRPTIAVDVDHPMDDDLFFRSDAGKAMYKTMGQYEDHFMALGVEFDYVLGASDAYETVLPGDAFEAYTPEERLFDVPEGYQVRHLRSDDDGLIIAYIRNRGETRKVGDGWHSGWLRKATPAPFRLGLRLPGAYAGYLLALEGGAREEVAIDGAGSVGSGEPSVDDYVLFLRKQ